MSKPFYFKPFSLALVYSLILFNPEIGPYQVLPHWASGPGSDGNEGVLRIPKSSNITGTLPSDYLVS